jgi:hypothetical protein
MSAAPSVFINPKSIKQNPEEFYQDMMRLPVEERSKRLEDLISSGAIDKDIAKSIIASAAPKAKRRSFSQQVGIARTGMVPEPDLPAKQAPSTTPPPVEIKPLPAPTFGQKVSGLVLGDVRTGETAIGRAAGRRMERMDEATPSTELPLVRFEAGTPERGVLSAAAKFGTSMTTAPNLLMLAGSGGLGTIARTTVGRLISAGFSAAMVKSSFEQIPKFKEALNRGDYAAAKEEMTTGFLQAGAGLLGLRGAVMPSGKMSPAVADAASRPSMEPVKSRWEKGAARLPGAEKYIAKWKTFKKDFYDEYEFIKELSGRTTIPQGKDPYVAARLFAGHVGKIYERMLDMRRILRPIEKAGLTKDLSKWMLNERHMELAARPDIGPTYKLPGGQTIADVQAQHAQMQSALGPEKVALLQRHAGQLRYFSNNLLTTLRDSGVLGEGQYQAILDSNLHYAPLQRMAYISKEISNMPRGARSFNVSKQDVVREVKGSEKEILDPLQGFIRNAYKAVSLAERNKVSLKMADLSSMPEYAGIVKSSRVTVPTRSGGQRVRHLKPGEGEGKFSVFRNGVKEEYIAPSAVTDAMKGMGEREIDALTKFAGLTNSAIRLGSTTMYAPFLARNALRDYQTATLRAPAAWGKVGFTPIDWLKGWAGSFKRDEDFHRYMESGAGFSGFFERAKSVPSQLKNLTESGAWKVGKTVLNPLELMRILSEDIELAPRLGVFKKAIAKGMSEEEAAFLAREVTVDFSKMGSKMRKLNLWIPFLNARTQGAVNTFKSLGQQPGKSAFVIGAMVGVPTVSTYVHNVTEFPDIWDDILPQVKDNYFVYIYGDKRDKSGNPQQVVKIPKGDVGRYFGNPLENFMEYMRGRDHKSISQLAIGSASDVSPIEFARGGKLSGWTVASSSLPPTLKAAVIEPFANKNLFTQRQIVPRGMERAKPSEQYRAGTPEWLVSAGSFLNISPEILGNAVESQFGGVGRQLVKRTATDSLTGEILERTGVAEAGRQFSGAKGGAKRARSFEARDVELERQATQRVIAKRKAEILFNQLGSLRPTQRWEWMQSKINSGELDAESMTQFITTIKGASLGLDAYERALASDPAESRARLIKKEMDGLPPDQRADLLDRWIQKKIITKDVAKEIMRLGGGKVK